MEHIYLDHAATTPVLSRVIDVMMPFLRDHFGNPSSIHSFGREARDALEEAQDRAAALLGCHPQQLVFTSGGTESDNSAVFGTVAAAPEKKHVIVCATEHHAVLNACRFLEPYGYRITYLGVDRTGRVNVEELETLVDDDTALISVGFVNNETGTMQPIHEIGTLAREKGIVFHVDAVQAVDWLDRPLNDYPVDLMSFSAHKIGGPKGTGALYVADTARWKPVMRGGAQQSGRRAGTENVAGIVGFAEALAVACENRAQKRKHYEMLATEMLRVFSERLPEGRWVVNGHPTERSWHISNVSFPGMDSATMLMNLDLMGVAASAGSACTSGSLKPSHVLEAMHLSDEVKRSSLRFSFAPSTTREEIVTAAERVATIVCRNS